jgi:hypothetical protein
MKTLAPERRQSNLSPSQRALQVIRISKNQRMLTFPKIISSYEVGVIYFLLKKSLQEFANWSAARGEEN